MAAKRLDEIILQAWAAEKKRRGHALSDEMKAVIAADVYEQLDDLREDFELTWKHVTLVIGVMTTLTILLIWSLS